MFPELPLARGQGDGLFALFGLLTFLLASLAIALVPIEFGNQTPRVKRLFGLSFAVLLLLWSSLGFWVRRYTGVGILVLRGAGYWIEKVVEQRDNDQALRIMQAVVDSSNKGVLAAESAVSHLSEAEDRCRLFALLARTAHTDRYHEVFRERASKCVS